MIRRIIVILCAAIAFAARPGGADVRPPVEVFILGAPRASVGGQEFAGTLQFSSGATLELQNLGIEGDPAAVLELGKRSARLESGATTDVPFRWKPSRDGEPLVISYKIDGVRYEKSFDLSEESVQRLREPGKTIALAAADPLARPAGPELTRVAPAPAPVAPSAEEARRREGGAERPPGEVNARNIRVRGRFLYTRNDGANIGADGVTVRIYDNDSPWGSELLAQVATDAQGWYDVTFFWNPCGVFCDSEPDIYVEFRSENSEYVVKSTAFAAGAYAWATGTVSDYLGTDLDFGSLWPGAPGDFPALHLLSTLTHGWRQHAWHGFDMPSMDCYWPEGTDGAYYNGNVHFSSGEQWIEGTIIHEQGHHWVQHFGVVIGPDYCNGICDDGGCGHCVWCRETDHDAWAEGFPNWMGEWIPSTFPAVYGYSAANAGDGRYVLEALGTCAGVLDDPFRTENILGALLHDIMDAPSDDHDGSNPWRDRLNLSVSTMFGFIGAEDPTTPANFLTKFVAWFPGHKENFWETAINCGYDTDALAPGGVTGLGSTSHGVGGNSPDPTADFYWTRASDDASGVGGYGISITGAPALPAAVQNLGNVTSYTSGVLSPGTYYFNIRARDRAGRWSTLYASYGPFTVRTPVPANLTSYTFPGWGGPAVPRPAADAVFGSVPNPTSLTGNAYATWWSMGGWNPGEQSTGVGFQARAYVDDVWHWWVGWGPILSGQGYYYVNGGPLFITGGRHTFEVVHDAIEEVAETNEADNGWAHQWVWSAQDVTNSPLAQRAAPPVRTAGWSSIVDGSAIGYNVDGLRFSTSGWWNAITLRPLDPAHDFDLRLHSPSTGPDNGFNAFIQWAPRVYELDAVLVNRNQVGYTTWDVGVLNWDGSPGDYVYEHVTSNGLAFGSTTPFTMGSGQSMDLYECYLGTSEIGAVSFVVQITDPDPSATPLRIRWLDQSFTTGELGSLPGTVTDLNGLARVDVDIASQGWHGLMVYREFADGVAPVNYTVRIHRTPPDFIPYTAAGWYSPFVPRPAPDGTGGSVPAPLLLQGDLPATYFNFGNVNQSPTGAPSLYQQAYEDGVYGWWLSWGGYGPYGVGLFNWTSAWTVRGGRHLLSTIEDPNNDQEEIWETNNAFGEQWVWAPSTLALGGTAVRGTPPDKFGGWDHGATGALYWNADGLRTPSFSAGSGWWGALAIMPLGNSDFDPRLHETSAGAQDGFAVSLAQSYFLDGSSDYVLANFNRTGFRAFDVGIVSYGGSDPYHAEIVTAGYLGYAPSGALGPFEIPAGRVLNLHEVYLPAGPWAIKVVPLGGDPVDLGVTLHDELAAYGGKADAVAGGLAYLEPENVMEAVSVSLASPGYYCISVWKSGVGDFYDTGRYLIQIYPSSGPVDVPEPAAHATMFRGAFPNPTRGATSLEFELAREQEARLEVFDLQGERVRTLAGGRWAPGVHRVAWSGEDDHGRRVQPGIYLVRFRSGAESSMLKLIRLH